MATVEKRPVGKGAWVLVLLALVIIGAAVVLYMYPEILEDIVMAAVFVVLIIIALIVITYVAMFILAIPMYIHKGEQVQVGASYSIDDVEGTGGEVRSDEKSEEKQDDSGPGIY
ncbi:hypothetical protein TALC_00968 [Thermoplasmatales archaeon BRNA1]|nr:hypothetical protein TALC_00968 [Thermoplasmatales archaeon BRNA1]